MIRYLVIGVWVCAVMLASSYGAALWAVGEDKAKPDEPRIAGREYRRMPQINIPMIIDGAVRGYVIAKLVYTADSNQLSKLSIDPQVFVVSAAFDEFYTNGRVDANNLSKYNFKEMLNNIKDSANKKLQVNVIDDVLLEGINYVDKNEVRRMSEAPNASSRADTADAKR